MMTRLESTKMVLIWQGSDQTMGPKLGVIEVAAAT